MTFQKGNIGGRFKMSYKTQKEAKEKKQNIVKKKTIINYMNALLNMNFISTCTAFCKSCRTYKKCPYICDYCNGHKVCKEMCSLPKLTKDNLLIHNRILSNKDNMNDDLQNIIPNLTDFLKSL